MNLPSAAPPRCEAGNIPSRTNEAAQRNAITHPSGSRAQRCSATLPLRRVILIIFITIESDDQSHISHVDFFFIFNEVVMPFNKPYQRVRCIVKIQIDPLVIFYPTIDCTIHGQ